MSIAVVYLARLAEGLEPLQSFANSYRDKNASASHRLVVLYKADSWSLLEQARSIFADIPHQELSVLDSIGIDIDAYRLAAKILPDERLCFLNTFSEVKADSWLAKLNENLTPRAGIVGSTASYEALLDSLMLFSKAVWMCAIRGIAYHHGLARYYEDILMQHARPWICRSHLSKALSVFIRPYAGAVERDFGGYWNELVSPNGGLFWYTQFPRFPNPHIRTNAFIVRRDDALRWFAQPVTKKENASLFECGVDGLTMRIIREGLQPILVSADGNDYKPQNWPDTNTFRQADQSNILISDNRTRAYDALNPKNKLVYSWVSWGTYGRARTPYGLGIEFPCNVENLILPLAAMDDRVVPQIVRRSSGVPQALGVQAYEG